MRSAHSPQGSLANLAARPAAKLAAAIEDAGQSADLVRVEIALSSLELEMTRLLSTLNALCEEAIP